MLLALLWPAIGLLIGTLACGARLRPPSWGRYGWLMLLAIGALSSLLGGWLGALVFGVQYATVTALWISVVGVVLAGFFGKQSRA